MHRSFLHPKGDDRTGMQTGGRNPGGHLRSLPTKPTYKKESGFRFPLQEHQTQTILQESLQTFREQVIPMSYKLLQRRKIQENLPYSDTKLEKNEKICAQISTMNKNLKYESKSNSKVHILRLYNDQLSSYRNIRIV